MIKRPDPFGSDDWPWDPEVLFEHKVSGRFSDDRIQVDAVYRNGALVELKITPLRDRIDVRDVRSIKFSDLESAALAGRDQTADQTTDPEAIRELLAIRPFDGSDEWRSDFALIHARARRRFRNPAARIAEANGMTLGNVYSKIREGRLRGDIPWSTK